MRMLSNRMERKGGESIQTSFTSQGDHPQLLGCLLIAYSHTLLCRSVLGPSHLGMPQQLLHFLTDPLTQVASNWLTQWYKVSALLPQSINSVYPSIYSLEMAPPFFLLPPPINRYFT